MAGNYFAPHEIRAVRSRAGEMDKDAKPAASIGPYELHIDKGRGEVRIVPTEYEAGEFTITRKGLEKLLKILQTE